MYVCMWDGKVCGQDCVSTVSVWLEWEEQTRGKS